MFIGYKHSFILKIILQSADYNWNFQSKIILELKSIVWTKMYICHMFDVAASLKKQHKTSLPPPPLNRKQKIWIPLYKRKKFDPGRF